MSAKRGQPIRLRPRSKIRDNGLSPSSLELYDLMYMETCVTAEALWNSDWTFCPVCMAEVLEDGLINHMPRALIEQ